MPVFDIALLVMAWCCYGGLHSALISPGVTRWAKRRLGSGYRFYRIGFNVIALITLVPVVWISEAYVDRGVLWWAWAGPWQIVRWGIAIAGVALFAAGARRYDLRLFLGAPSKWRSDTCAAIGDGCDFSATGILAWIRHPWYTGAMVIVWARPLDTAAVITNVLIVAYVIIGAVLEERKLVAFFGDVYRTYQQQVPMFFPYRIPRGR